MTKYERVKEWRKNNPELQREQRQRYYDKHKEQIQAYCKEYYQANKARIMAYQREYRKAHPERVKKWVRNQRERKTINE